MKPRGARCWAAAAEAHASAAVDGEWTVGAVSVQARAMVARLKPVRQLRPQALPVKLLAVGAFTGVANVPSGARAYFGLWESRRKVMYKGRGHAVDSVCKDKGLQQRTSEPSCRL